MILYKDNKVSGEFELSNQEIADKFLLSETYNEWGEENLHWPLMRCIVYVIGDFENKGGLQSTFACETDEQREASDKELEEIHQIVLKDR